LPQDDTYGTLFEAFFEILVIFRDDPKNEGAKFFEIAPSDFKFSHIIKMGKKNLQSKFEQISTVYLRFKAF